jgi:hypothetical protein
MSLEKSDNAADQVYFTFTVMDNVTSTLVDPAVSLVVRLFDPDGDTYGTYTYGTDDEVQRTAAGTYYFKRRVPESGLWQVVVDADEDGGTYEGVGTVGFMVEDVEPS